MNYQNIKTQFSTILFAILERAQDWDKHLPRILFEYKCGVHANIKFSLHMLLIRWTSRLKTNNFLNLLMQVFEIDNDLAITMEQMLNKLQSIVKMHGEVVENVNQVQIRQKQTYASKKGKHMFVKLKEDITYVEMEKPSRKISLAFSQEGLFVFVKYLDGNGSMEQDEGNIICVVKDKEEQLQDKPKRDYNCFTQHHELWKLRCLV